MAFNLTRFVRGCTDVIFPPLCLLCGEAPLDRDIPFCADCLSRIRRIATPLCERCGIPFDTRGGDDHLCGDCLASRPSFAVARALGIYESVLLDAIHRFKYRGKVVTGELLGRFMAAATYHGLDIPDYSLVIPVPLHRKKLRQRGFNQSLILAREIAKAFGLPLDFTTLKRHLDTTPQIALGREMRRKNVRGAFRVVDSQRLKGERILLVDDVYTTGSTVGECARALLKSGADRVGVLTLARTWGSRARTAA